MSKDRHNPRSPLIILLNGPPQSGKDTAAKICCDEITWGAAALPVYHEKFAAPLKDCLATFLRLDPAAQQKYFEDQKDAPTKLFGHNTPRAALIGLAERWAKPMLGQNIMADLAAKTILSLPTPAIVVFSDTGFQQEYDYLSELFGKQAVHVIHIRRRGCTYRGDSRGYISADSPLHIYNNGSFDELRDQIIDVIGRVIRTYYPHA